LYLACPRRAAAPAHTCQPLPAVPAPPAGLPGAGYLRLNHAKRADSAPFWRGFYLGPTTLARTAAFHAAVSSVWFLACRRLADSLLAPTWSLPAFGVLRCADWLPATATTPAMRFCVACYLRIACAYHLVTTWL